MMLARARDLELLDPLLDEAIDRACDRIAPTWPLDRFIAVNPLWGWTAEPLPRAAARLASLAGAQLLMPRTGFREHWESGRLQERHLRAAIEQSGSSRRLEELIAQLVAPDVVPGRRTLVTDLMDAGRDTVHGMSWCDFVAHSLSQSCAAYFDEGQSRLGPDREGGLYRSWRRTARADRSPALLMGFGRFRMLVRRLPEDPREAIRVALAALAIPAAEREAYLTSLLLRLNGWASWCAYRRWQARLAGGDDDQIVHLLALRLAWEWILFEGAEDPEKSFRWQAAMAAWPALDRSAETVQADDWLLQRALEIAYQESVREPLTRAVVPANPLNERPAVQAAFCIDVRSEVFRRALERANPSIQTLGFAGFFGLPIEYQPIGAASARPQLPGLLAPRLRATDEGATEAVARRRGERLAQAGIWKKLRSTAFSSFSYVEALGLLYAGDLIANLVGWTRPVDHPERAGLVAEEIGARKPRLTRNVEGNAIATDARADLAAGILRAMSLRQGFARLVVLAGHGSDTVNNPHAAGLDCGACCGQTGEVNARATAALLNDPEVRALLVARGFEIPATTHFLAALHHTTTDHVSLFELDGLPESHRSDVAALQGWLREAGAHARAERSRALGLGDLSDASLASSIERRTRDWSEVRPEWGLANNAAFIVAPRDRTRAANLEGRSFLHDYRWSEDHDFSVLELIMTAPMLVTHWINFQYYASTVDNRMYGSGNKVLHNVVGGHVGVFEGNGGDLRIGLPLQSLHDGKRWVHTPLRLSVFIEAPRSAIDAIIDKHEIVRRLIENEWIHLFQIDSAGPMLHARRSGAWVAA